MSCHREPISLSLSELKSLREEFIQRLPLEKKLKTGASIKDYENRTKLFLRWLEENNIRIVTAEHWQQWYAHQHKQGLKSNTLRNYYHNLKGFAQWLFERGHLHANPLSSISPPEAVIEHPASMAIPREDIEVMLEYAVSFRDRALFSVFRDTGCRGAEAAAMTWRDVDFEDHKIRLMGKGNKQRTVPFKPTTAEALQVYRTALKPERQSGPVWWGKPGPLTYSGLYQIFKRTARRTTLQNKRFNPHSWRHAFGRDTTRNGMPTAILQKLMGHESIETTLRYIEVEDSTLKDAYNKFAP